MYKKCREIIDREKENNSLFIEASKGLKERFSSEYMNNQVDLMISMCTKNPTEVIGKSKELIESCCKSILDAKNEKIDPNIKMSKLVKITMKAINVPNKSIVMDSREEKIIKQIIGSLNGLSTGIVELRNHYGSGHGRIRSFEGLSKKHAELTVGSSITLVRYMWDTFCDIYK